MDRNRSSRPLVTNTLVAPIPKLVLGEFYMHNDEYYEENTNPSICEAISMNTMGVSERDIKLIGEFDVSIYV